MSLFRPKTIACTAAIVMSCSVSALAESFVVNGNKALNTNNNFSKVDRSPRMSLWTYNASDRDQQFDRLTGNRGGTLLKHRSTGKCLNAHYLYNGGPVNVWTCNPNDPDQNFNINSLDNGVVQIKRAGTNLCVDSPTRDNDGKIHLWSCDRNNANQRFQNSAYEVWIVARKPENSAVPLPNDAGHAWIAIIRQDPPGTGWQVDTTYGFWPNENLVVNKSSERDQTSRILRGESISSRGFAVRKSRISISRSNWIKEGAYREAGCITYWAFAGTGTRCNCADYATRLWHVLTAQQDDFRIRAVTWRLTLDSLVEKINSKNRERGDFIDGGKTWQ